MITLKEKAVEYSLTVKKSDFLKAKITCSKDAYDYAKQFYFDDIEIYESFFLLLLNRANNTIGYVKISQGGTAGTVVDPKLVAKYAVESLASACIIIHNHPSGNTQPSDPDKKITQKIKDGLNLLDIALLDHLIITKESYLSFEDEVIF